MASPTGSLFSTHSIRIEEVINKSVGLFLPTYDPVWRDTVVSSQGVGSAGEFGRDWKILKVYSGGLTGVIEQGGPRADFTLYGDPSDTALGEKLHLQGLSKNFPSALDGMNQSPYRLGIPMRSMVTNIMLTLGELQAEATDAFIGEIIAPKMEGFARHISQQLCNYWYLSQNLNYQLTTVGTDTSSATGALTYEESTGGSGVFDVLVLDTTKTNFAVDRFEVGIRLNMFTSDGLTQAQAASGEKTFVVVACDPLVGKVKIMAADGSSLSGDATAVQGTIQDVSGTKMFGDGGTTDGAFDNGIVVYAGSAGNSSTPFAASPWFTGIAGINSWLKVGDANGATSNNVNTLLGAERDPANEINVNVHPEFKSFISSLQGAPLTEHQLRRILRRFHCAKYRWGQTIDCLIASDGVWLAYESQKIGREYINRTGMLSNLSNEGTEAMSSGEYGVHFHFDGHDYTGYTSSWIESGVVYGIKKGGQNWRRYVPPDPRGVRRNEKVEPFIPFRFAASALTGTSSNQVPIYTISANRTLLTEGVQLPGMLRMQLVPEQAAALKLTNVAEDRTYSDS